MVATKDVVKNALISGSTASLCSVIVLALTGHLRNGNAAEPINAISHWLWGERALRAKKLNLRHTALGYGIHHAASVFWALVFELWCARQPPRNEAERRRRAWRVAALAFVVDFNFTPKRLTPGFEQHLSRRERYPTYAAFAEGLALPSALRARTR